MTCSVARGAVKMNVAAWKRSEPMSLANTSGLCLFVYADFRLDHYSTRCPAHFHGKPGTPTERERKMWGDDGSVR